MFAPIVFILYMVALIPVVIFGGGLLGLLLYGLAVLFGKWWNWRND